MINQPESIPLYQAINMVGMAMYGAAWIAQLTGRERWLLERYAQSEATKMLVRRSATDLGTFKDWSSKDVPPSLQPEVESAIDRRDWQLSQWREVREWLTQHGFYCTRRDVWIKGQLLEREHFERAFTAAFPTHKKPVPASSPAALLAQTDQLSRLEESNDGDTTYQTGLPGRPSSWPLIEPECRVRYEAGERHSGKLGGESRAEWANTLIAWLKAKHPHAAVPKPKGLTNKLAGLLRELEASTRPKL